MRMNRIAGALTIVCVVGVLAGCQLRTQRDREMPGGLVSRFAGPATDARDSAEVWLCIGGSGAAGRNGRASALLTGGADWDFVQRHVAGLIVYINWVLQAPDEDLENLASLARRQGLKVAVECGGTLGHLPVDENNGAASARREMEAVEKIVSAGGRVDYLQMDGPVSRLLWTGRHRHKPRHQEKSFDAIEPCLEQLAIYMRTMRERYPHMQFFALTNFPNWGYKGGVSYHARYENRQDWGDYFEVVSRMIPYLAEAGVPLAGLTVDNPYDYTTGAVRSATLGNPAEVNWIGRVRDLEDYVRGQGLEFNLIINDSVGSNTSDALFREHTLAYLDDYRKAGGSPERWIVQSWGKHPSRSLPETDPESLTGVARDVVLELQRDMR